MAAFACRQSWSRQGLHGVPSPVVGLQTSDKESFGLHSRGARRNVHFSQTRERQVFSGIDTNPVQKGALALGVLREPAVPEFRNWKKGSRTVTRNRRPEENDGQFEGGNS